MGALIKTVTSTYIPGDPGQDGSPYVPARPARWTYVSWTECSAAGAPVIKTVKVYPGESLFAKLGLPEGGTTAVQMLGYVDVDANNDGVPEYTQFTVQLSGTAGVCTTTDTLVYIPPTAAIPAVPYAAPTPAQITVSLNQGWNSYARTVGKLLPGTYIEYTVKYGSYAALLAVGAIGMEGAHIAAFPYGIMVDTSGIYRFESGAASALASGNTPGLLIRIARLSDGRIVYSVGSEVVNISSVGTYDVFEELYVYGMLYSGYDEVSASEFNTGELIAEIDAVLPGSGNLAVRMLPRATLPGAGDLLVSFAMGVAMNGYGTLTAEFSDSVSFIDASLAGSGDLAATLDGGGRASFSMLALQFLASDTESEYLGFGSIDLPLFTVTGAEAAFAPATPTSGYFNLPLLTVWGDGSETEIGTGITSLPAYLFQASEGEYGIGSLSLPLIYAGGSGGFIADDALTLFSVGMTASRQSQAIDLVMILNSSGELSSSLTLTREQALELMSTLQQSDSFAMLGVYGYSLLSAMMAASLQNAGIGNLPDLDDSSAVWVVNIDTQASSQYDRYSFNSFIKRNGVCYGVAPDGIYRLDGETDAGAQVEALAYLGRLDFATALQKLMPNAYLGASSTGKLKLEVDADGSLYVYETRSSEDGTFKQHRVDLGRGLKANMLGLTVKNKDGADFKLATVDLLQAPGGRRI